MPPVFAPHPDGLPWFTEGGTETELMYRHGFAFDHFCAFTLLDDPRAMQVLHDMYRRLLDAIAASGGCALLAGLDYRASPDWGALVGYDGAALDDIQRRNIAFLREVSAPYTGQIPQIRIAAILGPRGDAYALNRTITENEAEAYHVRQIATCADEGIDLLWAATINNVPEAIGIARASAGADVPVNISFTLTENHRLRAGAHLAEAVTATDAACGPQARPDSYGVNCSHPLEFEPALTAGSWKTRLRSFRPNTAAMDKIALCKLDHLEEGDPQELAAQMGALARRFPQADIWGGCCGSWDTHLARIAPAVMQARRPAA
ncbi:MULTISPECIES: homocysteine S-methyltransferase family protein [unclassified Mameliella]|uniref:homocysteine S-methyltransferase family protein n=1 Tax=unclassified Mameliella TaxID=2630630 RepID=UPI00273E65A2|nr:MULTISPECIES: homocysteine S-methyltransferase family protein [unclassified Mameliella]